MEQKILYASENYSSLDQYFFELNCKKIFLVCDSAFYYLRLSTYFNELPERLKIKVTIFNDFHSNPTYESVVNGVILFNESNSDLIVAVGGGSSIDVAKCIKLFSKMNNEENYLSQTVVTNSIPFLVIPTTAGTGSEATKYAVIYFNGEKQSITHESCIPTTILFDTTTLITLPEYQKKSTMLDALCHSIESYWSVNSTEESKKYASKSIKLILDNYSGYLNNIDAAFQNMFNAANLAGKAINITQTTAGHAMCYKITSLYGISHGHAAAICVNKLWPYMINHLEKCIDKRGKDYLKNTFNELSKIMDCNNAEGAAKKFSHLLNELSLDKIQLKSIDDLKIFNTSVNPVRLKNNPIKLNNDDIDFLYHQIFSF